MSIELAVEMNNRAHNVRYSNKIEGLRRGFLFEDDDTIRLNDYQPYRYYDHLYTLIIRKTGVPTEDNIVVSPGYLYSCIENACSIKNYVHDQFIDRVTWRTYKYHLNKVIKSKGGDLNDKKLRRLTSVEGFLEWLNLLLVNSTEVFYSDEVLRDYLVGEITDSKISCSIYIPTLVERVIEVVNDVYKLCLA